MASSALHAFPITYGATPANNHRSCDCLGIDGTTSAHLVHRRSRLVHLGLRRREFIEQAGDLAVPCRGLGLRSLPLLVKLRLLAGDLSTSGMAASSSELLRE